MLDEYFAFFGLTGGVLLIIGIGLVLFLTIAVVLEHRTKLLFPERGKDRGSGDFLSFDEEDEDED